MTTGQRIRAARTALGWTQEELAEHSGTDRSTVSRAETGARRGGTLSMLTLVRFSRALGVTIDSLVGSDVTKPDEWAAS